MRLLICFPFLLMLPLLGLATPPDSTERAAVIQSIQTLFDGMRAADSSQMARVLHPRARLMTTAFNRAGEASLRETPLDKFLESIASPHDQVYDEKIWSYDVRIDGLLATAWTEYTFFLGDQLSHCGVNAFQLFKSSDGWQIIQITDTRSREGCQSEEINQRVVIDSLLTKWHRAAATADEDVFFGSIAPGGIYIGTDATEVWTKDVFEKWAQQYFERESAWAFTAKERQIHLAADGQTAWFEELLDTWMGPCRASGVLQKHPQGWLIDHYQLSVTVPNDKIKPFIKLLEN